MGAEPPVGGTIGSYRILSKLGEGGMGSVFKAVHTTLEREVALKILPERLVKGNAEFVKRFLIEARAAAKITHPNIVQVHDAGEENGVYYIAMEFVRGMDLKEILVKKSPLTPIEAVEIASQVARGLQAASEQNIVHRDIKPANLMITEQSVVKIADFGLAKNLEATSHLTQSGHVMGTPSYMSPEQAEGEEVDIRTDIYALGVTLFEMVTGNKPYRADTPVGVLKKHCEAPIPDPSARRPGLHPLLVHLIMKMMAKKPDERFQNPKEVLSELSKLESAQRAIEAEGKDSTITSENTLSDLSLIVIDDLAAESAQSDAQGKDKIPLPDTTPTPKTAQPLRVVEKPEAMVSIPRKFLVIAAILVLGLLAAGFAIAKTLGLLDSRGSLDSSSPFGVHDTGDASKSGLANDPMLKDRVARMLKNAESLEKEGMLQEALTEISHVVSIDANHEGASKARKRIETALEQAREQERKKAAYGQYWAAADAARTKALFSDSAEEWTLVLETAQKAQAHMDTEEVKNLVAFACGMRDFTLAKAADKAGGLDEAIRLAEQAAGCGTQIKGLGAFLAGLSDRKQRIEKAEERKKQYESILNAAMEEDRKGDKADSAAALALWKKVRDGAEGEQDRARAWDRIASWELRAFFDAAPSANDEAVNPPVRRKGASIDPETGLPLEIRLKSPAMSFVLIPAGKFSMGSPISEQGRRESEGPVRSVEISRPFYMAKYETTRETWELLTSSNANRFHGKNLPADAVTLKGIGQFISALTSKSNLECFEFRLPSEAEWEYACRAGTKTRFSGGDEDSILNSYSWHWGNSDGKTHAVGNKLPNAWGLYDMLGNVWELCEDAWFPTHEGAPPDGSVRAGSGTLRVARGGAWGYGKPEDCRCAVRISVDSEKTLPGILGFRLVMVRKANKR